jgi:alpha-beta hydrolase superfamily lysophospholipase
MGHAETPLASGARLLRIQGPAGGLGMLERRGAALDPRLPPVLLVHGATLGASLFDLPLAGYSLLRELADAGRAAYALDIRGFGYSMRGTVVESPPQDNPPFPRLAQAVQDIGAAVDAVLAREQAGAIDLLGFSWGTVTSCAYAAANPGKLARLALYAPLYGERNPLWLQRIAEPRAPERLLAGIGAYRLMTQAALLGRWNEDIGGSDPARYREPGVAEAVFELFAALDPGTRSGGEPAFRCPAGALADLVSIFNGRPLYDPSALTMPTLLVRGADDTTSTDSDARALLAAIGVREKTYRSIVPGSHFLLLERNRAQLYAVLREFLGPLAGQPGA